MNKNGRIFIISGPSGVGKDTLVQAAIERSENLKEAISATTRPPRKGEQDVKNYHFMHRGKFCQMIEDGEFLEYFEYCGNLYGTLKSEVTRKSKAGINVILILDVNGAKSIKEQLPESVTIFISPPSMNVLEGRLRARGLDSDEQIQHRLREVQREMECRSWYDYTLVNDDLEVAIRQLESIIHNNFLLSSNT